MAETGVPRRATVLDIVDNMGGNKYPTLPICSRCHMAKPRSVYTITQLKKHDARLCTQCINEKAVEVDDLRLTGLKKRVTQSVAHRLAATGIAASFEGTLVCIQEKRRRLNEQRRAATMSSHMHWLNQTIGACRLSLDQWLRDCDDTIMQPMAHVDNIGVAQVETNTCSLVNESHTTSSNRTIYYTISTGVESIPIKLLTAQLAQLSAVHGYYTIQPYAPLAQTVLSPIDWSAIIPIPVDPALSGGLTDARAVRKKQQVEFVLSLLGHVLRPGSVVVDVGSASGNFSLPLAALFPQCVFLLIDRTAESLCVALSRAKAAGLGKGQAISDRERLRNLKLADTEVANTDQAESKKAEFQIERCNSAELILNSDQICLGDMQSLPAISNDVLMPQLQRPRSRWMSKVLNDDEFARLAAAADLNSHSTDCDISDGVLTRSDTNNGDYAATGLGANNAVERDESSISTLAKAHSACKTLMEMDRYVVAGNFTL